ncbi:hypothetical protein EGR_02013 [Echinococcus granulosus]|uniref:Uncharacterized protein n=1 Tax=Echinococcus granulosus TaxID=6210 RepID=W6V9D5_ECHGR|nr:hypothetical protein EGR_02013 [Echinococcus granulosus]EUB63209.1 hypothetical protein EGR_02013 [Echinococcus granulosus]
MSFLNGSHLMDKLNKKNIHFMHIRISQFVTFIKRTHFCAVCGETKDIYSRFKMELRKMLPLFHVDNSILKVAVLFFLIKNFCISRTIRFIKKTTFHAFLKSRKDIIKIEFNIAHKLPLSNKLYIDLNIFLNIFCGIFTIPSSEGVGVTMAPLLFPFLHSILLAQNHCYRVPKQKQKMHAFI